MLNAEYWKTRYQENQIGWDVGYATTPFVEYFKHLKDRNAAILIPGCGHGYEGEALFKLGFTNITLLDYAAEAKTNFLKRVPDFPSDQFLIGDFFALKGQFDLILEQTFFCALKPHHRPDYAKKMLELLKPNGKLAGLLFKFPLTEQGPPFGGSKAEYLTYFEDKFIVHKMEEAYNSIGPRKGNELFFELEKPAD